MEKKLHLGWQAMKKHPFIISGVIAFSVLILFISLAYILRWGWTGFVSGTSEINITSANERNYRATISQPGKALWDWLGLLATLAIPVVVGLGAAWFTSQQAKASNWENTDNQRESALQAYIDKMSDLLLKEALRESQSDVEKAHRENKSTPEFDEVRNIARARTLTVLRRLDGNRKASVLQFLYESGLINKDKPIVFLSGADLSYANLSHSNLRQADLSGVDLSHANLNEAELFDAKLSKSVLRELDLSETGLSGADLSGADLRGVSLRGSVLWGVNLITAKLVGADLSGATLSADPLSRVNPLPAAQMNGTDLTGANLSDADLSGVNLNAATLNKAVLVRSKLVGANLMAAHLVEANLTDANLEGADLTNILLRNTIMPDGIVRTESPSGIEQ